MSDVSLLDRAILAVAPGWARRRARDRAWVAYYESATPSRARPGRRESGSGNAAIQRAGKLLREQARHLEQNHDLARGVLDVLVRNTVGTGIGVEPQPRMAGDRAEIADDLAWELSRLWREWCRRPEVTWALDMGAAERLCARTWFRDGEVFAQRIGGTSAVLDHGTLVPYSVELLEPDFVPFDHNRLPATGQTSITMGIETNAWNRPIGYWVYRRHPGEQVSIPSPSDLKRIGADFMLHLKAIDRIGQLRGASVFASVLGRLEDIKDYEESERVAAKVAASMAAMIIKGSPDDYEPPVSDGTGEAKRMRRFPAGMVFDDLRPGESVQTIDTKRPNPNALNWRQGQLRAVAAGVGTSYSSTAKSYDGTYSSQRQELVEQWGAYQILAAEFIARITRPIYEDFVRFAMLSRQITLPAGVDPASVYDAEFIAPQMPWIDPVKEVESWALLEDRAYASGPEIVRRRGASPHNVLDQQARWLRQKEEANIPAAGAAATEKAADRAAEQQAKTTQADDAMQQQARRVDDLRAQLDDLLQRGQTQAAADKSSELTAAILAVAAREPAAPNVTIHMPASPDIAVAAPVVNVSAPEVKVEPQITVQAAEPPVVNLEATIDVPQAPAAQVVVQAAAPAAAEAPKPWTTETTIDEFDDKGRAKKYRTRPIKD